MCIVRWVLWSGPCVDCVFVRVVLVGFFEIWFVRVEFVSQRDICIPSDACKFPIDASKFMSDAS